MASTGRTAAGGAGAQNTASASASASAASQSASGSASQSGNQAATTGFPIAAAALGGVGLAVLGLL